MAKKVSDKINPDGTRTVVGGGKVPSDRVLGGIAERPELITAPATPDGAVDASSVQAAMTRLASLADQDARELFVGRPADMESRLADLSNLSEQAATTFMTLRENIATLRDSRNPFDQSQASYLEDISQELRFSINASRASLLQAEAYLSGDYIEAGSAFEHVAVIEADDLADKASELRDRMGDLRGRSLDDTTQAKLVEADIQIAAARGKIQAALQRASGTEATFSTP